MDDQTIPDPDVLPLAERVSTPLELPDGGMIALWEIGVVSNALPLKW